jgi:hypothetical protein
VMIKLSLSIEPLLCENLWFRHQQFYKGFGSMDLEVTQLKSIVLKKRNEPAEMLG